MVKLMIGLGNPDEQFANTYHNAGRLGLEALCKKEKIGEKKWEKHKDLFEYAKGELGNGDKVVLVRPLTYMNESGKAVRGAVKKFEAKPDHLFVFHDDSDILIGDFKISFARNSAGHKGVQSIIDTLRTNKFFRVRIGIRPQREKQRQKAGEFALKQITPRDRKELDKVFAEIIRYIQTLH